MGFCQLSNPRSWEGTERQSDPSSQTFNHRRPRCNINLFHLPSNNSTLIFAVEIRLAEWSPSELYKLVPTAQIGVQTVLSAQVLASEAF